jgi:hypothetical protein
MFSTIGTKAGALGLVLCGIVVGVAGAQVATATKFERVGSTTTGLFTIAYGEAMNFHVALDDEDSGPIGKVQMRLYDHTGTVRAKKVVSLAPGQSATLPWDRPGKYRAQYDVLELESATSLSDRREVAGTVEVHGPDNLVTKYVCGLNVPTGLPIPDPK